MAYRIGPFELDPQRLELRRCGTALAAEPQVLSLLLLLVENRHRLVTKEEIIEKIWAGRIVSDAAIASRIKSARQLLADDGKQQRMIRTIYRKGIRFVGEAEARLVEAEARASPSITSASQGEDQALKERAENQAVHCRPAVQHGWQSQ